MMRQSGEAFQEGFPRLPHCSLLSAGRRETKESVKQDAAAGFRPAEGFSAMYIILRYFNYTKNYYRNKVPKHFYFNQVRVSIVYPSVDPYPKDNP